MVETHLIAYGILKGYTFWYHHGERADEVEYDDDEMQDEFDVEEDLDNDSQSDDEMDEMIKDLFPIYYGLTQKGVEMGASNVVDCTEEPNDDAKKFFRLIKDFEQPAYPGSTCSKLSAMVKLLHIKSLGRWSNESFTMLLEFLKNELLPFGSTLAESYYEAKKTIKGLGLSYNKIDACRNDCMLFWKEDAKLDACKVCHASRWKDEKHSGEEKRKENGKKISVKGLFHFLLKPRLQRLFMCSKIAAEMRWHYEERIEDGVMRHLAYSKARKTFDELH